MSEHYYAGYEVGSGGAMCACGDPICTRLNAPPRASGAGAEERGVEEIAKIIYDAMREVQPPSVSTKPWVEGGNAISQDIARYHAKRIIASTVAPGERSFAEELQQASGRHEPTPCGECGGGVNGDPCVCELHPDAAALDAAFAFLSALGNGDFTSPFKRDPLEHAKSHIEHIERQAREIVEQFASPRASGQEPGHE